MISKNPNKNISVKRVKISKLIPWAGNPRKHGEDINLIVSSLEKFGFTNPILVQKNTMRVIAGHGRLMAAQKAGLNDVPVIELDLNDKDADAYTITDNKTAENSEWDFVKLKDILVDLNDGEFDLQLTGFDENELKK